MALDLVQGVALMLVLCWLLSISGRYWNGRYLSKQVTAGILFGGVCVVGMLTPVVVAPGVFVDLRSNVIALATLFGGPLTGVIALAVTTALQLKLGGAHLLLGVAGLVLPFLMGLAYRQAVESRRRRLNALGLMGLGVLIHASSLSLHLVMESPTRLSTGAMALIFLIFLPTVTVLLGLLFKDADDRRALIQATLESAARLRAITKAVPDMLLVIDEDGRYLEVVSELQMPLYSEFAATPSIVGKLMSEVLPREYAKLHLGLVKRALRANSPQALEYTVPGHEGQATYEVRANRIEVIDGSKPAVVMVTRDISLRRTAEGQIRTLALYDPLTSLPNRSFLLGRLPIARRESARNRRFAAVVTIDLDDFGSINDSHGIIAGDRLLQRVAECLSTILPVEATLARWGPDEFVVLLEGLPEVEEEAAADAARVGHSAVNAIARTAENDVVSHGASASVGIALFRGVQAGDNPIRRADLALLDAKAAGKGQVRIFDPVIQDTLTLRLTLENEIRLGLTRAEFVVYYQPQLDRTGRTVGVEALVRWQHPVRGLRFPGDFLTAAERAGVMYELDTQVLTAACQQLAVWAKNAVLAPLVISVNIGAFQMSRNDFADEVLSIVRMTGANACRLKLELTETALVNDLALATRHMVTLRRQGVSFALDDFGTGYSSMSYLQRLPLDQLKIDQSFVKGLPEDRGGLAIVRAIIALAASFGFEVLAEGVETESQRNLLVACGCQQFQGYLFSRPVPVDDLEAALEDVGVLRVRTGWQSEPKVGASV